MRTLKEEIRIENELEMLTESVIEKHLQKLIEQLKRFDYPIKSLFKIAPIAWDKIDASRVTVYRDPSDSSEIKEYISFVRDDDYIVFGIKDGLFGVMFYKGVVTYLPTKDKHKGKILNSIESRRENEFFKYDMFQKNIKTKAKDMLSNADEVIVINTKGKLNISNLKNSRVISQQGVWENTPEFYAKWLKNNIDKYKKKVEVIRAQKNDEFVPLSEKVMQIMELISKEMIDLHKNSEYGQWGHNSDLNYSLSYINGRCQLAFNDLDNVLHAKKELEKAKNDIEVYGEVLGSAENYISKYSKNYNSKIQVLKDRLQDIEDLFAKYKQEKESYIENFKK